MIFDIAVGVAIGAIVAGVTLFTALQVVGNLVLARRKRAKARRLDAELAKQLEYRLERERAAAANTEMAED